jgi:hypothetical protein
MWHLHWRADNTRRSRPAEPAGDGTRVERRRPMPSRDSFQYAWHDTPAAVKAADIPESVRVRGR